MGPKIDIGFSPIKRLRSGYYHTIICPDLRKRGGLRIKSRKVLITLSYSYTLHFIKIIWEEKKVAGEDKEKRIDNSSHS